MSGGIVDSEMVGEIQDEESVTKFKITVYHDKLINVVEDFLDLKLNWK